MKLKKLAAAALSLTILCGALPAVPGGYVQPQQVCAADPYDEIGSCYEFDSETCTMYLKGNVSLNAIKNFDQKNAVKAVYGLPSAVLPAYCSEMFADYVNCEKIDLASTNTENVEKMYRMFYHCLHLKEVILSTKSNTNTFPKARDLKEMFLDCQSLESADLSCFAGNEIEYIWGIFSNCFSLKSVDLTGLDTHLVTYMNEMFSGCSSLTSIDLSSFDTSSAVTMEHMFYNCSGLSSIDVSGFDTSKVTDMNNMFSECSGLSTLDLSSFDTSNVKEFYWMFRKCSNLTSIDLSSFNTSSATNMVGMFFLCSSLKSLDLRKFDTSNVTNMNNMFTGCSSLNDLKVNNLKGDSLETCEEMFSGCSSLESLMLSYFSINNIENTTGMFENCTSLKRLALDKGVPEITENMKLPNGKYGWAVTDEPNVIISGTGKYAKFKNNEFTNYTRQYDKPVPFNIFPLKGLAYPAPGTKPDLSGLESLPISDFNPEDYYTIDLENTCWINASTNKVVGKDEVFQFGVPYVLRVRLIPTDYTFFSDINAANIGADTKIYGKDGTTVFGTYCPGSAMIPDGRSMCFYCTLTNYCNTSSPVEYVCGNGETISVNKLYPMTIKSAKPGEIDTIKTNYLSESIRKPVNGPEYEVSVDKKKWYRLAEINGVGITGLKPNTQYTVYARVAGETDPFYNKKVTTAFLSGDVNSDMAFSIADVVALQRWLLTDPEYKLANWKAADLCADEQLDVFDLCQLKNMLLIQKN